MATRVRLRYILMTPLNCLTSKTPVWCKNLDSISFLSRVISIFVPKFVTNGGHLENMQINPVPGVRFLETFFLGLTMTH